MQDMFSPVIVAVFRIGERSSMDKPNLEKGHPKRSWKRYGEVLSSHYLVDTYYPR